MAAFINNQWERKLCLLLAVILLLVPGVRADINVPGNYSTIQAAIDAAQPGDIIHLAAGRYAETLSINKSLSVVGSGSSNCVVYCQTNIPIVSVNGPGKVILSNFEIEGGNYMGAEWYNGLSPLGIAATNADLVLDSMVMNQIINYFVAVTGGSLAATNVALWTRNILAGCDVGFALDGCTATITGLTQDAGHLDHTININGRMTNFANVAVDSCRIRTSSLSYGNCIRTYVNSKVTITNCYLYRGAGEAVPAYPAFNHSGISVNGYSNTVIIAGNIISNVPWAMYCYGSLGGNHLLVESNNIINSPIGGIIWDTMAYTGIDLGGGNLGSRGGNVFSQSSAPAAGFCGDVVNTNSNGFATASIFALHNTWSNPVDKESVIYDKLDKPNLGRVITDDLMIKSASQNAAGRPVISWNERGAGESYTVETLSDLATGIWTNAPGAWPVTNSGLNDMCWTNPATATSNMFFRIRSVVP